MSSRKPFKATPSGRIKESSTSARKLESRPISSHKFNANSTMLSTGPQTSNATRLNATVSRNLEETFCRNNISAIGITEDELEHRLAYNSYLQALLKQQLITKEIKQHSQCISDQILQQSQKLQQAKDTLAGIRTETKTLEEAVKINEWLQSFKSNLSALDQLYSSSNVTSRQQTFSNILSNQLERISLSNIKPIESQEEFHQLQSTLQNLGQVLESHLNVHENIHEVKKLADCLQNLSLLNNVIETTRHVSELNQKTVFQFLVSTSDAFARAD